MNDKAIKQLDRMTIAGIILGIVCLIINSITVYNYIAGGTNG